MKEGEFKLGTNTAEGNSSLKVIRIAWAQTSLLPKFFSFNSSN